MKLRQKLRNKPYIKPIVLGFLGIYLIAMWVVTNNAKKEFEDETFRRVTDTAIRIEELVANVRNWNPENITQEQQNYLRCLVSGIGTNSLNKYLMMSAAIYDTEGNLIAESENTIGNEYISEETGKKHYYYYSLAEYLTEEEIEELARYRAENFEWMANAKDIQKNPPMYHIPIKVEESTGELAEILVCETKWEDTGKEEGEAVELSKDKENHYWGVLRLTEEVPIWEWKNPSVSDDATLLRIDEYASHVTFPHLEYGLKYWKKWQETEILHNYPQTIDDVIRYSGGVYSHTSWIALDSSDEESTRFRLLIRIDSEPWLAAIVSERVTYLYSFLFIAVCTLLVLYFMDKSYKKQAVLEETRRDFTNAIAHELKTPLGVIRGFSENLAENTVEEKREYYLRQIIGQTEVMDDLVQEMIYVSKLDSENLVLKKEDLSFFELIESQLQKLEPAIKEKNLQIDYKLQGDFTFSGDKLYLEKAVWNLLSNACEYNWVDGKIQISIGNSWCSIENTGNPISSEDLPHVCDMFYSSDKSRTSNKKHMGMGLYLAKKIFTLHRLNFTIENSSIGVKVIVTK